MAVIHAKQEDFNSIINSNEIVFVDFWAKWCAPCRAFGPIYEKVSDNHPEITFIKIDIDENQQIAQEAGIRSIPTIKVIKNRLEIWDHKGSISENDLEMVVNEAKKVVVKEEAENNAEDEDNAANAGNTNEN
ncbi:putative thioredoxin [Gardnerella vaginalis]|uniref:Putative thioredoxin n=1 Tax=Gardnerella vaginalis TaxID=2702 RepID=A0A135Z7T7_GARVA|nr:thioredoxin family protein [Gardnerella vaginalis]KXI17702.1 putative thioredoxin [Gardnerella vaginalis]